jgi:hypothetical protein
MQAVIVLGDFAERDSTTGKVHILGAGWSVTGPQAAPQAGQVVTVPGAAGVQRLEVTGQIEMAEPEGWEGSGDLDAVFSVNVGPLQLQPGAAYSWHVDVDGKETATTGFRVRPASLSTPASSAL